MKEFENLDRFIEHIADMLGKYGEKVLDGIDDCGIMTSKEGEIHAQ